MNLNRQQRRASYALLGSYMIGAITYLIGWRLWVPRSNPWIWLGVLLLIIFAIGALFWYTCRLCCRRQIAWPIGYFLLMTTPLVWVGTTTWHAIETAHARGNLQLTAPMRVLAVWACGAAELEAWWRYPRRVEGQYVELVDANTTGNAQALLEELDAHIVRLAKELDAPIPPGKVAWVRGDLLGFGSPGRAIISLAICDRGPSELGYVDYHEVAHTLITRMAGPDQDPPMLLAEGYAQSHSSGSPEQDRIDAISGLASARMGDRTVSLADWVSPENYGRSYGPAYSHGSPFVLFLIERYGGPKFLELYTQCRRETFVADFEGIYGKKFADVESDFWSWYDDQAQMPEVSQPEEQRSAEIKLAEGVDPELWERVVEATRGQTLMLDDLPPTIAIAADVVKDGKPRIITRFIRERDRCWIRSESHFDSHYVEWLYDSPDQRMALFKTDDQSIEYATELVDMDEYVKEAAQRGIPTWLNRATLESQIPLSPESGMVVDVTVQRLIAPQSTKADSVEATSPAATSSEPSHAKLWEIEFTIHFDERESRRLVHLDESNNFLVAQLRYLSEDEASLSFDATFGDFLGKRLPVLTTTTFDGGKTTVELRLLDDAETKAEKAAVDAVIQQGPDVEPIWERIRIRPQFVAYAWPGLAVLLLLIGMRRPVQE